MEEYRREQRIQPSRAIANNETGNRQLKEFVDNRNCSVNHLSEVVQRHKPKRGVNFGYDMIKNDLESFYLAVDDQEPKNHGLDKMKHNILGDSDDQGVQLGWSSIMSFTTEDDYLTNFNKILGPDIEDPNAIYSTTQVVTRGVDTCTFIVVSNGKNHVTAHLDGKDVRNEEVMISIIDAVPLGAFPIDIYVSLIDDRAEDKQAGRADFVRSLIEYYFLDSSKKLLPFHSVNDKLSLTEALLFNLSPEACSKIQILDRGKPRDNSQSKENRNYLQHPEIGVYLNDKGKLCVFGSLSHSDDREAEITGKEKSFETPLEYRGHPCYLTTACVIHRGLLDNCEELTVLRYFRDTYLINKPGGKDLITAYYAKAPYILANIHKRKKEEEDVILESIYGIVRECVDAILNGDNEFAFRTYCDMVVKLDSEYGN